MHKLAFEFNSNVIWTSLEFSMMKKKELKSCDRNLRKATLRCPYFLIKLESFAEKAQCEK